MAHFRFTNQYSSQPEKIIKFYRDVIGLEVYPDADSSWFGFSKSTAQFAVEPESNRKENTEKFTANWKNPYLVQIAVDSIDEMKEIIKRAKEVNIKVLTELDKRSYGTVTKILDPDNNLIELLYGWSDGKD